MLGLLITLAFLGHDVAMASAAVTDTSFTAATPSASSHTRVIHIIAGGDIVHAGHDHPATQPGAGGEGSNQSSCGITRDAVPAANDLLILTLQTMTGDVEPIGNWQDAPPLRSFGGAPHPAPREQRIWYQVFLI